MLRTSAAAVLRSLVAVYACLVTSGQQFQDDLYRMELSAVPEVVEPGQTAQLQCRRTSSLVQSDSLGGFGQSGSLGGLGPPRGVEWVVNARSLLTTAILNNSCVVTNRDSLGFQTVNPQQLARFRCLDDGVLVTLYVINMTALDDATAWQCKHWPLGESDVTVVRVNGPNMRQVSVSQLLLTPSSTALVRKGGEIQLECRALSASPPPSLAWLQQLPQPRPDLPLEASGSSRTTFDLGGGLSTTSVLYFRPKMSDEGTSIRCRALDREGNVLMTSLPAIITIIVPTTTTAPPPSTLALSTGAVRTSVLSPSPTPLLSPSLSPSPSLTSVSEPGPGLQDGEGREKKAATGMQGGVVAGIVICLLIFLVVAALLIAWWIRRRRLRHKYENRGGRRPRVSVGLGGYMMPDGSVSPSRALPIEHHIYTYVSPDDHNPVHVSRPTSTIQTTSSSGNLNGFCNGAYGVDRSYLRLTSPDPQAGRQLPPIPSESPDEYATLPALPSDDAGHGGGKAGGGQHDGERYENVGSAGSSPVDTDGYEVPISKADFKRTSEPQHSRVKFDPDLDAKYVNAKLGADVSTDGVTDRDSDINSKAVTTNVADVNKRAEDATEDAGGETVDEIDVEIGDTENDIDWGSVREGKGEETGTVLHDASLPGSDDNDRQLRRKKSEVMSTDL